MKKNTFAIISCILYFTIFAVTPSIAQWVQTNGPVGGGAYSMVTNGSFIFATVGGNVYRSSDSGESWVAVDSGLPNTSKAALAILPGEVPTLFVGVASSLDSNAVFRSINNGVSWEPAGAGLYGVDILTLTPMGGYLFAGAIGGCMRSSDNGTSWQLSDSGMNIPGEATGAVTCFASIGTTIFAGTDIGVFSSTDWGVSWNPTTFVSAHEYVYSLVAMGTNLCAGGIDGMGLVCSTDLGQTWTKELQRDVIALLTTGGTIIAGAENASGNGSGLFLSTDSGTSWNESINGLTNFEIYSLAAIGGNTSHPVLFAGSDAGGIYRSTDMGAHWSLASNGLIYSAVESLTTIGNRLYAGTEGSVFLTSDSGDNWQTMNEGISGYYVASLAAVDSLLYASVANPNGGVSQSTDLGATWTATDTSLPDASVYTFATQGTIIYAGGDGGVYQSTDSGRRWTNIGFSNVSDLDVNYSTLYAAAGSDIGIWSEADSIWDVGQDGGSNSALAAIGTTMFAASSAGVYRSSGNGTSWVPAGLTNRDVISLISDGTNLFAGTWDSSVYFSPNQGQTWINVSQGLPNLNVFAMAIVGANLYAGTYGAGVWRRSLSDIFALSGVQSAPSVTSDIQCFPNPSSGVTNIDFTAQESGTAEITILNTLGSTIAQVYSGTLSAGEHSFAWNGSDFARGTYFCEVAMNGTVQRASIVLDK